MAQLVRVLFGSRTVPRDRRAGCRREGMREVSRAGLHAQGKLVSKEKRSVEFCSQDRLEQATLLMARWAQPGKPSRKTT